MSISPGRLLICSVYAVPGFDGASPEDLASGGAATRRRGKPLRRTYNSLEGQFTHLSETLLVLGDWYRPADSGVDG